MSHNILLTILKNNILKYCENPNTWWCHNIEMLSILLNLCEGNPTVTYKKFVMLFIILKDKCIYLYWAVNLLKT